MIIPKSFYVTSQTFNSEFLEFVWQFPRTSGYHDQFICQIWAPKPMIYMECGVVNEAGDYTDPPVQFIKLNYGHLNVGEIITNPLNWPRSEFPDMYNIFTNGTDLIPLIEDSVAYLKSI